MFEVLFTAVGIIFILAIVIPVFLIYTAYNFVVDLTFWSFIAEYWLAILVYSSLICLLISVIPIKRIEEGKWLTLLDLTFTKKDYYHFFTGLALVSFMIFVITGLLSQLLNN